MSEGMLRVVLIAIAGITVLSGLTQWIAPQVVLSFIATADNVVSRQLFATIGMFMVITGAMFLQALRAGSSEPAIPLWISAQKIFAALLVGYAVYSSIFTPISLGVAAFDGLSGVLAFFYWRRLL